MRLIDADKFKVYLQEYLHYGHAIPWVDAQPTAYNVDKVVEELEAEKHAHTMLYRLSEYREFKEIKERYNAVMQSLNKAIEIVKKGGV